MSVLCFVIVWPVCILLYIWAGMGRGNQVMNHSDRLMSSYRDWGVGGGPATTHKLYCIFIWCGSCQQQHSWQQGVRRSFIMCSEFFLVECRKIIRLHAAGEQRWIVEFQDVWQLRRWGPFGNQAVQESLLLQQVALALSSTTRLQLYINLYIPDAELDYECFVLCNCMARLHPFVHLSRDGPG